MGGGVDVGPRLVDLAVDGERRRVHRPVALDDVALAVDEDEIGRPDLAEAHAERVDPEPIGVLGIAAGQVAGDALVEPEAVEQPERRGHALLQVHALLVGRLELGELVGATIGHGCSSRWSQYVGDGAGVNSSHSRRISPAGSSTTATSRSSRQVARRSAS